MTSEPKETVYIDVDEEITGIVDKATSSKKKIVALVLPKRAAVLQSIVNMKLLKRAADQNDKQVVLITSEARLLPLAGAAGLFVAPNLTSKPYIPPAPTTPEDTPSSEGTSAEEVAIDPSKPVSEVAPDTKFADDEPLEIDNTVTSAPAAASPSKPKKKIPNFNKFRKKLVLGALAAILLIGGSVWAIAFAPKAKITIKTGADELGTQLDFIADPKADNLDEAAKIVPAKNKEVDKNDSEKVPATGQKDNGTKASGTVSLKNCVKSDGSITIPAGTGISSGEFTFLTQSAVTLPASEFSGGGACTTDRGDVSVLAQQAGDKYNLGSRSYSVAGNPSVQANGTDMSGGTSKIVKVVSPKDIDIAKERLAGKQNSVQDGLKKEFEQEGYQAIGESFKAASANFNPSPGIDAEANEVTVSVTTKYTMLGVKKDDLKKLLEAEVKKTDQAKGQSLLKDGIAEGTYKISQGQKLQPGQVAFNLATTVIIGPEIKQDDLKRELAGKKKGPAEDLLKSRPGILDPKVELSPFWVAEIPGKASRVSFDIRQADGTSIRP